jgi:hypothetical protein
VVLNLKAKIFLGTEMAVDQTMVNPGQLGDFPNGNGSYTFRGK